MLRRPCCKFFWHGFLTGPDDLGYFATRLLWGIRTPGLRYYDAKRDANAVIFDIIRASANAGSAHLDVVFESLHRKIRVKRGRLFFSRRCQKQRLIFMARRRRISPAGNPGQGLCFRAVPAVRPRQKEVVNVRPDRGEAASFSGYAVDQPLVEDYAVVALVPGLNPGAFAAYSWRVLRRSERKRRGVRYATEFSEELLQGLRCRGRGT